MQGIPSQQHQAVIHRFPKTEEFIVSEGFTDPFRYIPHPLVRKAARLVMERLERLSTLGGISEEIAGSFKEGKMLGVLVCRKEGDETPSFISAFSGSVGGSSQIDGFVPPIFDLTDPEGHFKTEESEISSINMKIKEMEDAEEYLNLVEELSRAEHERDLSLSLEKEKMRISRKERQRIRSGETDRKILEQLTRESQHEKAEHRRLKLNWEMQITQLRERIWMHRVEIDALKTRRAEMSDRLQDWIFRQYKVHNALGEESSVLEIFRNQGLTPPGGTGDCAAPKLLEYAYRHNLRPLAMGEFWYGESPSAAVRTHGHFYPSCTSKCGPLLGFMMKGLTLSSSAYGAYPEEMPEIIYEDEALIVVCKPSGMPSVPGLDGRISLQEWLEGRFPEGGGHAVHRLDMDTSGIMVFAKTPEAAAKIRKQFEEHTIKKTYLARLSPRDTHRFADDTPDLKVGDKGRLELPLGPDYDERPRQKVDGSHGKESLTEYEVISINLDNTADILFHPLTGRTHQLRVHSAHILGLGRPILGDLLYGGWRTVSSDKLLQQPKQTLSRLHLHALSISFTHPKTEEQMSFFSRINCFL